MLQCRDGVNVLGHALILKTGSFLKYCQLVNSLYHLSMIDLIDKLFENDPIMTRMGCNSCISKLLLLKYGFIVILPWHCANTYLNAPDQQPYKTSAFTEVVTLH